MSRVYISLPLAGPSGKAGREVLRGAELAFETAATPITPVLLDSSGGDRDAQAVTNARHAAEDRDALAYLGDFHSSQILATAPILGEASLAQVAPVATFAGLEGPHARPAHAS